MVGGQFYYRVLLKNQDITYNIVSVMMSLLGEVIMLLKCSTVLPHSQKVPPPLLLAQSKVLDTLEETEMLLSNTIVCHAFLQK